MSQNQSQIAVIVTSHNYGEYLPKALDSIKSQTKQPAEIIVVNDNSTDNTEIICKRYNIPVINTSFSNPLLARKAGFQKTKSDIVCFLDADDWLSHNYFEKGIELFTNNVAIVYSDICHHHKITGTVKISPSPDIFIPDNLYAANFIHVGALVKREAILLADAFNQPDSTVHHEDWLMWRKIIRYGFTATKGEGIYNRLEHKDSLRTKIINSPYYLRAALDSEQITVASIINSKETADQFVEFINEQSWPKSRLEICTIGCAAKHVARINNIKEVRYHVEKVKANFISRTRAYNSLSRNSTSPMILFYNPEYAVPNDVIKRLLKSFDNQTASVTAACKNGKVYNAINNAGQQLSDGLGVNVIKANTFDCVLIRGSLLKNALTSKPTPEVAFYNNIGKWQAKIDWSIRCYPLRDMPTLTNSAKI